MFRPLTGWVQQAFTPSRAARRSHRRRSQVYRSVEPLETRTLLTLNLSSIIPVDLAAGKTEYIPLDATETSQLPVNYTVTSSNSSVSASILTGGRSIRMHVTGVDSNNVAFSGDLTFRLFEDLAPATTSRIIDLVNSGFYNNLIFHRVIDGFVAQGGDPTGTGTGGSGVKLDDEFTPNLTFNSTGLLAMANSGDDTGDSQFFITDVGLSLGQLPTNLNFNHTIFGILTSGFDTFQKLISTPTNSSDRPLTNETITSASIFTDTEDAVLKVTAASSFTGTTTITVNASTSTNETAQQAFGLKVVADTVNDRAYLGPVPATLATNVNTPITFNVTGIDLQNDSLTFVVKDPTTFSETVFDAPPQHVSVSITQTPADGNNPARATITITPDADFVGTVSLLIGVRDQTNRPQDNTTTLNSRSNFDTQKITLTVNPAGTLPDAPTDVVLGSGSDDGLSSTDNYTSNSTPTIQVTAPAGSTVKFLVNDVTTVTATETSPGKYTATLTAQMIKIGVNNVTATVTTGGQTSIASAPLSFTYAPSFQNVYTVPGAFGSSQTITFSWTIRDAAYNNEFGVYVVDNLSGSVNGILPGSQGYAKAALSSAGRQVLFASGTTAGQSKTLTVTGGQFLAYYMISNNSTSTFLAVNPNNNVASRGGAQAFFSFASANPDKIVHMQAVADATTGQVLTNWEDQIYGGDRDYNDSVITVTPSATASSSIAEAMRVPSGPTQPIQLIFDLEQTRRARDSGQGTPPAKLGGEFGLFVVSDNKGTVNGLLPTDPGYLAAVFASSTRQVIFGNGDSLGATQTLTVAGGSLIGYYYIPGSTAAAVLATNPTNAPTGPVAFFSFDGANPGGTEQFRWFGPEGVGAPVAPLNTDADLHLHISDKIFSGDADFDAFMVGINFKK